MKRILLAGLLLLIALQSVHAVAIGVNRASVEFADVLRGGYAETVITITTDSEEVITAEVMTQGPEAEWLNLSATNFTFSKDLPYELKVAVLPPLDAQVRDYEFNVSVITGSLARNDGGRLGTSTRASFRVPILLRMSGTERLACTVGGVIVHDVEQGNPLDIELSVINRGNVRINPEVTVEVFDQLRARSLGTRSTEFGESILPTVTSSALRTLSFELQPAQYWASVSVPQCDYSTLLTFDVLEPGAIKDEGELIRIDAPAWANTGEIIPVNAIFRNKGARAVRASFKGTIARADTEEIVKVIDTEQYIIDPDVTAEIQTFFNPVIGGQYVVSGKVYYNSKLTGERETLINVNGAPIGERSLTPYVLIGLGIVILMMLILIKRKRTKQ